MFILQDSGILDHDPAVAEKFNDAFWKNQELQVFEAFGPGSEQDPSIRVVKGLNLANAGFPVQLAIHILGQDPYIQIRLAMISGYTWLPGILGPAVGIAPGFFQPTVEPYDPRHPAKGALISSTGFLSLDPADWHPAARPDVAPTTPPPGLIGAMLTKGIYNALMPQSSVYRNGDVVNVNGVKYQLVFTSIFNPVYWKVIASN